jgi:hypothetical protein
MYRLISEWDLGQEDLILETIDQWYEWLGENPNFTEVMSDNDFDFVEDVECAGLISFQKVRTKS